MPHSASDARRRPEYTELGVGTSTTLPFADVRPHAPNATGRAATASPLALESGVPPSALRSRSAGYSDAAGILETTQRPTSGLFSFDYSTAGQEARRETPIETIKATIAGASPAKADVATEDHPSEAKQPLERGRRGRREGKQEESKRGDDAKVDEEEAGVNLHQSVEKERKEGENSDTFAQNVRQFLD